MYVMYVVSLVNPLLFVPKESVKIRNSCKESIVDRYDKNIAYMYFDLLSFNCPTNMTNKN